MLDCKRATPKIFAVNLVAPLAGVLPEIRTPVLRGKTKSDRKDGHTPMDITPGTKDRANNQKCDEARTHRPSRRNFLGCCSAGLAIMALNFMNLNPQSRASMQKGESDHFLGDEGPENKVPANVRPISSLPSPSDDGNIDPVAFLC